MKLNSITYNGPEIDDVSILERLPSSVSSLLKQLNGYIQFNGGFHFRGACKGPEWHSLRCAWEGEKAIHALYDKIMESDIPFGEDGLGFQFLLRDNSVIFLDCETGEVEELKMSLKQFLDAIPENPLEILRMHPLIQFQKENKCLEPGYVISEYPFFFTKESGDGVSLESVPIMERRMFLAELYKKLKNTPDGAKFSIKWE